MIIGIGTDIVSIKRIRDLYEKNPDGFIKRIYSEDEQEQASVIKDKSVDRFYNYLAKRFAAKEAISKALGTGIGQYMAFTDASITNDAAGKPMVTLTGAASATLARLTPEGQSPQISVSLSDESDTAIAMIIISVC